jgi:hypothetical protein
MMGGPLVLAELVRQYRVDLPDAAAEPVLETQLSLHPKGGVRLRLIDVPNGKCKSLLSDGRCFCALRR